MKIIFKNTSVGVKMDFLKKKKPSSAADDG